MKFSVEWLRNLSGYRESAEKLADVLSMHAFETEIETAGQSFNNIIVAKVLKVEKHPNADRLRVVELTDGKRTIAPVVCGAWNFQAGALVPLALPGALIPHDQHDPEQKPFTLTKATIRGIESQGMICSGKELGVSDDGNGILLLDGKQSPGSPFAVGNGELIFDISIPANRPDLVGYRGIAREIAALTGSKLDFMTPKPRKSPKGKLKVAIEADTCLRYSALNLTGIAVKDSPDFIQKRLIASGLRPINIVVDITNYVMLETGQPLHAFDAGKVKGTITARISKSGERIRTLDGTDRELPDGVLLIADDEKPLAIAGIIGGEGTAVLESTTDIILESANFNSVAIRRASRAIGVRTDASARFEKSLPVSFTEEAIELAAMLLTEHAGASVTESAAAGRSVGKPRQVTIDTEDVSGLLGMDIPAAEQKRILSKFGFGIKGTKKLTVTVPPWRPDVSIWQDLAEEIGRYVGINEIEAEAPSITPSMHMSDPYVRFRHKLAENLAMLGFSEIYTYSFVSTKDLENWGIDKRQAIEVANPLSLDQQYMRTNLLMNDLKVAEFNSRSRVSGRYFDIGNAYWMDPAGKIVEEMFLCVSAFSKTCSGGQAHSLVTGAVQALGSRLNVRLELKQDEPGTARIEIGGSKVGYLALKEDADFSWAAAHLKFSMLMDSAKEPEFKPISRYPTKELDVSILADAALTWSEILAELTASKQPLLKDIRLFDVYQGHKIPPDKRSLSFRLTYQADDRTLTDKEVMPIHAELMKDLANKLNLTIRE